MINYIYNRGPENDEELLLKEDQEEENTSSLSLELDDNTGSVLSVKDGVAFCDGLPNIQVGELVTIRGSYSDINGMALNLETEQVGIILFGDDQEISQGDLVIAQRNLVSVEVGYHLLGRVVDPLANFLDSDNNNNPESRFWVSLLIS